MAAHEMLGSSPGARLRVVIVGGGFAGLNAARALRRAPLSVTVIDSSNHHVFQPLLYQVATAGLSPADIAAPIRAVLARQSNASVLMAEVTGVDTAARVVYTTVAPVPYDYLVIATGSAYSYFGHEDWRELAPSLKSIPDAIAIRERILTAFEQAETEQDDAVRQALLTFVIVGAGPSGVELAGAIAELTHRTLARDFRRVRPASARILVLEAASEILGAFPARLARAAHRGLERLGVEVRTGARVEQIDRESVIVSGERIAARTVLWTAGVVAPFAGSWLGSPVDRGGRVLVGPDLRVPGIDGVFVIGDAAHIELDGRVLPGLAPVAMQEGRYVARVLERVASGGPAPSPFRYRNKGVLATVGRSFAVADLGWFTLSGLVAWVAWLVVHIYYLIGFRNRVLVMLQWAWAYFTFQRGARLITGTVRARGGRYAGSVDDGDDSAGRDVI